MIDNPPNICFFSNFKFDPERLALFYQEELVKDVDKKSLQVLAVLLQDPGNVIRHETIIEQVWQENPYGVTPARVNQYISKLQKAFAKFEPEQKFIENLKGRGYIFTGGVSLAKNDIITETNNPAFEFPHAQETSEADEGRNPSKSPSRLFKKRYIIGLTLIFFVLSVVWTWYGSQNEIDQVKSVVMESQMYESYVLYKNPSVFKEEDLDKYWTKETDINSNYDRQQIRKGVSRLIEQGKYYGNETKCEQFDFQTIEINTEGDLAVVKTLEKWFIAEYQNDGRLIRNKYVGPYFVSYIVRKVGGQWLIEKSNTARANPL
jgi:DNA-binding winged helix-turn-helix (wHTH) protein